MSEIGGDWHRRDDPAVSRGKQYTQVRYSWHPASARATAMQVCVTDEGLHLTRTETPLRTEGDLEGIERVLLLAHRQYIDRLLVGGEPYSLEEDRMLYAWLGEA